MTAEPPSETLEGLIAWHENCASNSSFAPTIARHTAWASLLRGLVAERDAAARFNYLLEHHSYRYGMSHDSPMECGIEWQFQQTKPGEQLLSIGELIDLDIEASARAATPTTENDNGNV